MILVLAGDNKAKCSIKERNRFFHRYETQAKAKRVSATDDGEGNPATRYE
jgi:hypothetical protein